MIKKVCVVITARPSYSRVKTALSAILESTGMELQIVVTASALLDRYGNVSKEIESDGFTITSRVYSVLEGESPSAMAKTTGIAIIELTSVFERLKPDIVVTIADRYETIATAISATYLGIPLVHLQGGEVTGSIDERVRHAITKLSDYHFACTQNAAENIIKMGEHPSRVFVTGCPSIDIANQIADYADLSFDLYKNYHGVGNPIDLSQEFVVSLLHPVTNEFMDAERQATILLETLNLTGKQVIWFWPNVDAGSDGTSRAIRCFREKDHSSPLYFIKNINPKHFLELIKKSSFLIGNSSVGIRECSFLGVPSINIGSRQQHRERGSNVIDCDWTEDSISRAISNIGKREYKEKSFLYGDGYAGEKIAHILNESNFGSLLTQKCLFIN